MGEAENAKQATTTTGFPAWLSALSQASLPSPQPERAKFRKLTHNREIERDKKDSDSKL